MSVAIQIPAARQPVIQNDANGNPTFTRPWFLFFQAIFNRVGGATDAGGASEELDSSIEFVPEVDASLYMGRDEIRSAPDTASLESLRAEIAELRKSVQDIQQGTSL